MATTTTLLVLLFAGSTRATGIQARGAFGNYDYKHLDTHSGTPPRVITTTVHPHTCSGDGCEYVDMATCNRLDTGQWRCNTVHSRKIHTNTTVACEKAACKIHTEARVVRGRITTLQFVTTAICIGGMVALVGPGTFFAVLIVAMLSDCESDRTITTTTH